MKIFTLMMALACGAAASQPNIVMILIDDMSWVGPSVEMIDGDSESKSDFYLTPNIERLAEQGVRFSQAYSPSSMCTPSRAGILTGKTPAELHMTTPGRGGRVQAYHKWVGPRIVTELPTSEKTIAEVLKKEGYATAHLGKWHLGTVDPGQHGFDVHDGATGNEDAGTTDDPKEIVSLTTRAEAFMESNRKQPFYLQISHYALHTPIQSSGAADKKFSRISQGERHTNAAMAAMTWDLDESIGRLLEKIDDLGIADNTVVVLMSDNGGAATPRSSENLPLSGGKGTLYEGGIRVPLIVSGPGFGEGRVSSVPVTGCDLFPTFCDIAGVSSVGDVDGVSLMSLLEGKGADSKWTREQALLFHYPHYGNGPNQKPQSALISGSSKLVKSWETGEVELFDLEHDLYEEKNIIRQQPEQAKALEVLLEARLQAVGAQGLETNTSYDPTAAPTRQRRR